MQLTRSFALVTLSALGALSASAGGTDRLLSNEGLVVLARAGYNERFLAELIHAQPGRFDTSVEGLVYLAKQGISERIVRLVIAEQKAAERHEAESSTEPLFGPAPASAAAPEPSRSPTRLKVVKQRLLVPAAAPQSSLGPNPVIVVEKRMFGDRYYALPGAQAPVATPVDSPRAPHSIASSATRVAAFH